MIKIKIPNNNLNEREYIINILFNEFLGLKYKVEISDKIENWELELSNGKTLIILDSFFNLNKTSLSYLRLENIPSSVEFTENEFIIENDIPILFGNKNVKKYDNSIICGIDIFAASFFMLIRWEEHVNKKRDKLNRFSASDSIAFKNNFLERPIVNEYTEMLWNILIHLGYKGKRKKKDFKLIPTHDVDFLLLSQTPLKIIIKTLGGDILKRKNFKLAVSFLKDYVISLFSQKNDPYNTFEYIMDTSEKKDLKSYFFFMGEGKTIYDNNYSTEDNYLKEIISKIKKRNHHVGIHPTFNAYNDFEQFKKEKNELEENLDSSISFGREHYLRFEVPTTWQIWEDNNMEWDSSLGYHDKEGFRCGVCYEFSVFNVLTRKKLKLKEKPLIFMEGSFIQYQSHLTPLEIELKIKMLKEIVQKYNGEFVFLWHNSSFNNRIWGKYQYIYEKVLK